MWFNFHYLRSKIQAGFQFANSITGNLQFCSAFRLEADDHATSEPGMHFINEREIQECGAMDADESRGIELALEFVDRRIHNINSFWPVAAYVSRFRVKIRDAAQIYEDHTLAQS